MLKSPLRYPGGKSKAIKQIAPHIPQFSEYREPFVGGGSVFTYIKQKYPDKDYWINDLNYDLYLFWKYAQQDMPSLIDGIRYKKNEFTIGKELFNFYRRNKVNFSDLDKAIRFFILNRITFSGLIDSGGYSEEAFKKRFTDSSINRLLNLSYVLDNTKITNEDFEVLINNNGHDVFLFLDPPYYSTTKSKLYGKNGDLHIGFDHKRLAKVIMNSNHKWLITYDDCEEIRTLYSFAYIASWPLQYGMNNIGQINASKGNELFISNYPLINLQNN